MPSLSIVIVHAPFDPVRRVALKDLRADLGMNPGKPLPDGVTSLVVSEDTRREGCWINVRRGLKTALAKGAGATHVLHLSEDMKPGKGFVPGLLNAIEQVPDRAIGLMTMGGAPLRALEQDKHWLRAPGGSLWGGASVWPVEMVADFLAWERTYIATQDGDPDHTYHHDDGRMCLYLEALGVDLWMTAPCLVTHRIDMSSVMGHGNSIGGRPKTAQALAGDNGWAAADVIDWSLGAQDPVLSARAGYGKPSTARKEGAAALMDRRPWTTTLKEVPGLVPGCPTAPEPRTGEVLR